MPRGLLGVMLVLAIAVGCYSGPHLAPENIGGGAATTSNTPTIPVDLPCDVAAVLEKGCLGCHGTSLAGGAPNPLTSLAELTSGSKGDPSISNAALAAVRMRDTVKPMPPSGALAEEDIAVIEAWVAAGTPAGACESAPGASTNYDTPTVCTSGTMWTRRNHGSSSMHPGVACITCHSRDEGPRYFVAGTVYPTAHEPDDCNGASGATIEITGADGATISIDANAAGNFGTRKKVALPYRARVIVDGAIREMKTPQTNGDCNSCHTLAGANDAPGRVMLP